MDTLVAHAVVELHRRTVPLSKAAYTACKSNFVHENFVIDVRKKNSALRFKRCSSQLADIGQWPLQNDFQKLVSGGFNVFTTDPPGSHSGI